MKISDFQVCHDSVTRAINLFIPCYKTASVSSYNFTFKAIAYICLFSFGSPAVDMVCYSPETITSFFHIFQYS